MYGFLLQDWVTIRGATTISTVTQSESGWLDLRQYQDAVFWVEVRELSLSGLTSLSMNLETAPLKDESLYVPMATQVLAAQTQPFVLKAMAASASQPLARWVRWRLSASGTASTPWDATFRISMAANALSPLG